MLSKLFKSVMEQDRAPIVICDINSTVVYMNPSAKKRYGIDLTGRSIRECHPPKANEKIDRVLEWFLESRENNIVYTYRNDKENKDVYMVALRDEKGEMIGYYEKHEYRSAETSPLYGMGDKL
ncbi:MAG: PAS domain-containing protein [Clostridia bacterium]|nr:PAS domain-containing protein [Clostridia bacterium]